MPHLNLSLFGISTNILKYQHVPFQDGNAREPYRFLEEKSHPSMSRHLLAQNQDRLHRRDASEINKAANQVYATGSLKRSTGAMLCKLNSFLSPTLFDYEQRSIENRNCYGRICIDSIHSRNRKKILQPIQYERSRNYC